MRKALLAVLVMTTGIAVACREDAPLGPDGESLPGVAVDLQGSASLVEVGVLFEGTGAFTANHEAVLSNVDAHITYRFKHVPAASMWLPASSLESKVSTLRSNALVRSVGIPSQVQYRADGDSVSWERLKATGRGSGGHGFEAVVDSGYTASGIKVLVAGTGIDCDNSDLTCADGETFASDSSDWDEDDLNHETGVASIIAALVNSAGRYGWARSSSLYSGRIFNASGGATCQQSAEMMDWAIDEDMDVVNMSYSGEWLGDSIYNANCETESVTANQAANAGILLIASAGNISGRSGSYPDSVGWPARLSSVMAVGGWECGSSDGYACQGLGGEWWSGAAYGSQLDIAAAAHKVLYLNDGGLTLSLGDGVSYAVPMVSAAAALAMYRWSCDDNGDIIRDHLNEYAGDEGDELHLGAGVLDALAALNNDTTDECEI